MKRSHAFFAIICLYGLGTIFYLSNLVGGVQAFAAGPTLPLPSSPLVIPPYGPIVSPVLNSDPAQAMPIAVGGVASGGNTVSVQLQTYPFDGPVDVYFAFSAPVIDPVNIYIMTPGGAQPLASAGLVPYLTTVLNLAAIPFGDLPVSLLSPGTYNLFLAITPSGSLRAFDYWATDFVVGEPAADIVYIQPQGAGGILYHSSRLDPDGSDYDKYVWDNFTLGSTQTISKVTWRGGYDPNMFGSGGPVVDFTISIYASIPAGTQPDVVNPPLVEYHTGGNAGETQAGVVSGTTLYDYAFTLPTTFRAQAGTKYWIQIEASQLRIPDWGIATGTGGDGIYFRRSHFGGDNFFQAVTGDAAFSLK